MKRLLLPDAPDWFFACPMCSGSLVSREHVRNWRERIEQKQLDGSLWSWCGKFFEHQHFHEDHDAIRVAKYQRRRKGRPPIDSPDDQRYEMRLSEDRRKRYERAAAKAGLALAAWIKRVLDRAAR